MSKTAEDYLQIIDEIERIRSKNNKNWMDLLRLAFRLAPEESAAIVAEIYQHDSQIAALAERLTGHAPSLSSVPTQNAAVAPQVAQHVDPRLRSSIR